MPAYSIGLLSDTHDRLHPRLPEVFAGVDEIWHLGDICSEEIIDALRPLAPRLVVVLGNNDFGLSYPLTLDLEREGEAFHLVHIPPREAPPGPGWLLHGHTHRPRDERSGERRVFNPGSAGLANKGAPLSLAILTREPGSLFTPRLILLPPR